MHINQDLNEWIPVGKYFNPFQPPVYPIFSNVIIVQIVNLPVNSAVHFLARILRIYII